MLLSAISHRLTCSVVTREGSFDAVITIRKLYKLDEPDTLDTAGEARTSS